MAALVGTFGMAEAFRRRQRADVHGLMSAVLALIGRFLGSLVKLVFVPSRRVTYTICRRQRVNRLVAQPTVLAVVGLPRRRQDGDRQYNKAKRSNSEVVPLRPTFHLNTSFPAPMFHVIPRAEKKWRVPITTSFRRCRQTPILKHDDETRHVCGLHT